jgi:hypothetical protein
MTALQHSDGMQIQIQVDRRREPIHCWGRVRSTLAAWFEAVKGVQRH